MLRVTLGACLLGDTFCFQQPADFRPQYTSYSIGFYRASTVITGKCLLLHMAKYRVGLDLND